MKTKAKILFLLIIPLASLHTQNRLSDTTNFFQKPDSTQLRFLYKDQKFIRNNLSLKLNLSDLKAIPDYSSGDMNSYSNFYQSLYGITPLEKNKIDKNLIFALQNTLYTENKTITFIRKYLGIGQDLFAIILAIIHLAKYY